MKKLFFLLTLLLIFPFCLHSAQAAQIGDVDCNGILSAADARLALRQSVSLEQLQGDALIAADADNDNAVTASDARKILRVTIGLERFSGAFSIDFIDVGQAKSILVQKEIGIYLYFLLKRVWTYWQKTGSFLILFPIS